MIIPKVHGACRSVKAGKGKTKSKEAIGTEDMEKLRAACYLGEGDILAMPPQHANQRFMMAIQMKAPRRGGEELCDLRRSMFSIGRGPRLALSLSRKYTVSWQDLFECLVSRSLPRRNFINQLHS